MLCTPHHKGKQPHIRFDRGRGHPSEAPLLPHNINAELLSLF